VALVKVLIACAGLAVVAGGAWALLRGDGGAAAARVSATDLSTAAVTSFDVTTASSGELEAKKQIEIRNRLEAQTTVQDIIKEGVFVRAGEVLVRLNADEIQRQVDEVMLAVEGSKAEVASAENAYEIQVSENESALRKARLGVDLAELDLRKWLEGEVVSKRQANELALDKARRELERLKEKYDQSVRLEAKGFLSRDELKRDELAFLEAQAALATAELNKQVFEDFEYPKDEKTKQSALDDAKAELDRVASKNANELASKEAARSTRRQQLALHEARRDKLLEQVASAVLKAPQDGLVVHATSIDRARWGGDNGPLQIGTQVYTNQLLIVLPDTSEMVASVRVPEAIAGRVRPGQTASVKIDALAGKSVRGTVQSVGILAETGGWRDPNLREYTIKIGLDLSEAIAAAAAAKSAAGAGGEGGGDGEAGGSGGGSPHGLRPSMRCEAEIILDRVEDALSVPIQAVFSDGLVRYVLTPKGGEGSGRFARVPVKVGRRSDRFAEITAGLTAGARVLVRKAEAGEVDETPWQKTELAAVGLDLSPDGKVVPAGGGGGRAGGGERRRAAAAGAGGPNGGRPAGAATVPASAEGEGKPADGAEGAGEGGAAKPASADPAGGEPAERSAPAAGTPAGKQ
jgi:multidrug resistance efflux pump